MSALIIPGQLYQTVLNAAEMLFNGGQLTAGLREELVCFILAHTNRSRGFVFYPTPTERAQGIRLISGEKPRTLLLANNALELETLRLLALLQPGAPAVQALFAEADRRLRGRCFSSVCLVGECAAASIAYLRYLTARGVETYAAQITHGLAALAANRSGRGRWHHFPARFTRRWLMELPADLSAGELAYCRALET